MVQKTYATRNDFIDWEIIFPIENGAARAEEFDIEAIADEVMDSDGTQYWAAVDTESFWDIVAAHQL